MPPKAPLKTPHDLKQLGTILSIWAHPDDESFACAAIMAAAIKNGQRVVCLTATRGEKGTQDTARWPADKLAFIREQEMQAALTILGISEHHFLNVADGACASVGTQGGAKMLQPFIEDVRPNTILTFGPDGYTGHPDHQAVSQWVSHAVQQSSLPITVYHWVEARYRYAEHLKPLDEAFDIFFNIDEPPLRHLDECDICLCCTADCATLKLRALQAMPSQTESLLAAASPLTIDAILAHELFVQAPSTLNGARSNA